MCLTVLPVDTDAHSLHAWCRWGAEEGVRPWDWSGNYDPPNGYRELSSGPLQEQPKDVNVGAAAPPHLLFEKENQFIIDSTRRIM